MGDHPARRPSNCVTTNRRAAQRQRMHVSVLSVVASSLFICCSLRQSVSVFRSTGVCLRRRFLQRDPSLYGAHSVCKGAGGHQPPNHGSRPRRNDLSPSPEFDYAQSMTPGNRRSSTRFNSVPHVRATYADEARPEICHVERQRAYDLTPS